MSNSAYNELRALSRESALFGAIDALLSWDQETYMPPAGAASRAEQSSALAGHVHQMRTAPRIGELIAA